MNEELKNVFMSVTVLIDLVGGSSGMCGNGKVVIKRSKIGPRARNDSQLLYWLKQLLNAHGFELTKRLMWKDGHLYGDNNLYYLRSRNPEENPGMMIYDGKWQIRDLCGEYNKGELVDLLVTTQFVKEVVSEPATG